MVYLVRFIHPNYYDIAKNALNNNNNNKSTFV
jgi:hypothetical protein